MHNHNVHLIPKTEPAMNKNLPLPHFILSNGPMCY